jgi:ABC-type sugar transport system ATPase subunit
MIYQELSCMPALTVAENVFPGQPTYHSLGVDRLEENAPGG